MCPAGLPSTSVLGPATEITRGLRLGSGVMQAAELVQGPGAGEQPFQSLLTQ